MLEFISTLSVIALMFCAATVFVALVAGGILKAARLMRRRRVAEKA